MLAAVLAHGYKGAAAHFGLHVGTVKHHMSNLNNRLGVFGRVEAAIALGWLSIPEDLDIGAGGPSGAAVLAGGSGGSLAPMTPSEVLAEQVVNYIDGRLESPEMPGPGYDAQTRPLR